MQRIDFRNANGFPPTICIQLTNWCNLSCSYCRSNSSPHNKQKLNFEALRNLLFKLSEIGKWRVSLTGGEPFFYTDLKKLLNLIIELGFPFSITTNGYSTKNKFDTIRKSDWEAGTLCVSIDGSQEVHNLLRGKNSYENAVEFIKFVRPKVNRLFVNTVLFRHPKHWASELLVTLSQIGIDNWTIISPVKKGRWFTNLDIGESFLSQYQFIQNIAMGSLSTSFLDFAKTDSMLTDIVFIDSDNTIRLPGYFNSSLKGIKPLSKVINMEDENAFDQVVNSVHEFIKSENYML